MACANTHLPEDSNDVPGGPLSNKSRILEAGSSVAQDFTPINQICAHLTAFHVYASDPTRCVESNHYCSHITEDFRQCLIYDSPAPNARLIGVEYMVSPRLFETLPPEERKLWHTHEYEVKSGMLVMPGPPGVPSAVWDKAETSEMYEIAPLYGKVYHFWQVDRGDPVPMGAPELMGSFLSDDSAKKVHPEGIKGLLRERDERLGISFEEKRHKREGIPPVEKHPVPYLNGVEARMEFGDISYLFKYRDVLQPANFSIDLSRVGAGLQSLCELFGPPCEGHTINPKMERLFRTALRKTNRANVLRLAINGTGAFCACTLFLGHCYTVQLSEGISMYPSLQLYGDFLLISRRHNYGKGIEVGDLVRFQHPSFAGMYAGKRVLGMPGDFVCKDPAFAGNVGETGEMIQVPEGHVYVCGDNMLWSRDSRNFGPIPLGLISGKITAIVWPPRRMRWLENNLQPAQLHDDTNSDS